MELGVIFTNKMSASLMAWLNRYSKENKMTKRQIIEEALKQYQTQLKKDEYAKSFQRANNDVEIQQMTEEGFSDYFEQLNRLEQ